MSSPRDRDGFEQRPDDGSGWREPGHLGGDGGSGGRLLAEQTPGQQPPADGPAADRSGGSGGSTAWQPPGWDLPPAAPDRPAQPPAASVPGRTATSSRRAVVSKGSATST